MICRTPPLREAFTGDFSTRYRAQVKTHIGVTIDGKYLGPDGGAEKTPGEAQ